MATKETQRLRNRARSYADQLFVPRHKQEYEQLFRLEQRRDPDAGYDLWRSRARDKLRRKHHYEWAALMSRANELVQRQAGWVDPRLSKRPIMQVTCPTCGAEPGRGCRSANGVQRKEHVTRKRLALSADGVVQPQPGGEVVLADPRDVAAS